MHSDAFKKILEESLHREMKRMRDANARLSECRKKIDDIEENGIYGRITPIPSAAMRLK